MTMNRDDVEAVLDAYALDLLDESDRVRVEQALESFGDLAKRVHDMQATVAALGYPDQTTPRAGLEESVMSAALHRRSAGKQLGDPQGSAPADCYAAAVGDLAELLDDLVADEFAAQTVYGFSVLELVRHLSGVDAYVGDLLGVAPFSARLDDGHVRLRDHVADPANTGQVLCRWRRHSDSLVSHTQGATAGELERVVTFHDIQLSAADLLVARAFEIWTHTEDICRATARPLRPPAAADLFTMADLAVRMLSKSFGTIPRAVTPDRERDSGASTHLDKTLRLTLTGSGGGSWVSTLGGTSPAPVTTADATLVADAATLCRMFANRVDDVDTAVAARLGDQELLDAVISRIPRFADFGEN